MISDKTLNRNCRRDRSRPTGGVRHFCWDNGCTLPVSTENDALGGAARHDSSFGIGPWTVDRGPKDRGPWTVCTRSHAPAWECRLRRSASSSTPRTTFATDRGAFLGSFGRGSHLGFVRQNWVRSAEQATLGSFGRIGFVRKRKPLGVRSAERDWVRSEEEATWGSFGRTRLGSFGRRSHLGFVRQNAIGFVRQRKPLGVRSAERDWVRSAEEATLGSFGSSLSPSVGAAESFQLVKEPGRTGPYPWYRQHSAGTLRGFRESHRNSPPRSLCGALLGFAGWASLRRRWAWEGDAGIAQDDRFEGPSSLDNQGRGGPTDFPPTFETLTLRRVQAISPRDRETADRLEFRGAK